MREGDILMTITGYVGRVIRLQSFRSGNINQHIARIRINDEGFDPGFIYHYLSQPWIKANYETITTGQAYPQISLTQVRETEIPVLPVSTQRIIAAALDAADDLVSSLERLIEKKREIKQGLMQELLTGRTRLPGFKGDWVELRVANASHLKARIGWQGLKTGEYRNSGEYRLVGGTDFRAGRVNWESTPFVDKWRYDQDKNIQLQEGDVLITKDGTIGKVALVENLPGPATLNSGVFVLRPKHDAYDPRFIFVMLRSRFFEEFVAGLSAGSTINHLYQKDLVTLILTVPSAIEEQKAIARVLLDADDEIAALERRLESARAIKQGMMQELLTGRTRLAEEVAA